MSELQGFDRALGQQQRNRAALDRYFHIRRDLHRRIHVGQLADLAIDAASPVMLAVETDVPCVNHGWLPR